MSFKLERFVSSSSLRTSSSTQGTASPIRLRQKSFGRQPARVAAAPDSHVAAAPAPVPVAPSEDSSSRTRSLDDAEFVCGLQQDIAPAIEDEVDHEQENTDLRGELEALRQELKDLREASSKNDEVWQRDNARLKEQLTTAHARETTQQEQVRIRDDQLALCRQEISELLEHQLKLEEERAVATHAPANEVGSSGLGRERELLKLVVQLVGAPNVRAVLRENPNASPIQLHEALVRLRCSQCRHLAPQRAQFTGQIHGERPHRQSPQNAVGASSRPPSPLRPALTRQALDHK